MARKMGWGWDATWFVYAKACPAGHSILEEADGDRDGAAEGEADADIEGDAAEGGRKGEAGRRRASFRHIGSSK